MSPTDPGDKSPLRIDLRLFGEQKFTHEEKYFKKGPDKGPDWAFSGLAVLTVLAGPSRSFASDKAV